MLDLAIFAVFFGMLFCPCALATRTMRERGAGPVIVRKGSDIPDHP